MAQFENFKELVKNAVNGDILVGKNKLMLVCPVSNSNLIKVIGIFSKFGIKDFKPCGITNGEMSFTFFNK